MAIFYRTYFLFFLSFQVQPCGIAFIKLRQSLPYYFEKYNMISWGLDKLYLLMEKQRNRGKDGVGVAVVKSHMPPGEQFIRRARAIGSDAIDEVFKTATQDLKECTELSSDETLLKCSYKFLGDVYLGHLRYGTHCDIGVHYCQPYIYKNNVAYKNCVLIGNFNMANTKDLFTNLVGKGVSPTSEFDAHVILNSICYYLDKITIEDSLSKKLPIEEIIHNAAQEWDGGYVFAGTFGNGDSFICRDPAGIRPCFFYCNDEVIAAASERAALTSVFDVNPSEVQELKPGSVLVIRIDGSLKEEQFAQALPERACTFERIYYSRVNDPDIYQERKDLGKNLANRVIEKVEDLENTIFTYIPNSGEASLIGLIKEIDAIQNEKKVEKLWEKICSGSCQLNDLYQLKTNKSHLERLVYKDQVLRTFITVDKERSNLVSHIYDITRGVVKPNDILVVMDDSIVRGTTLRKSIMKQLCSLKPKHIIFVSSAPPIMYSDCYGIDMSQLENFIIFQAVVELLKQHGKEYVLDEVAQRCYEQAHVHPSQMVNYVKELYNHFSLYDLEEKVAQMVSAGLAYDGKISIIYQTIDGLHNALPNHHGDWYFTGDYPTPSGYKVLNTSYLNWYNGNNNRAY